MYGPKKLMTQASLGCSVKCPLGSTKPTITASSAHQGEHASVGNQHYAQNSPAKNQTQIDGQHSPARLTLIVFSAVIFVSVG